ncbi:hypothetical protein N9N03_01880, partial [Chlamydiia bacterium]|nr:hypothetical protein [Chlamydiia bacterium]
NIQKTASQFEASAKGLSGIEKKTNSIANQAMEFFRECYRAVEYFFSSERTEDKNELKNMIQEFKARTEKHDTDLEAHTEKGTELEETRKKQNPFERAWNSVADSNKYAEHNAIGDKLDAYQDETEKLFATAIKLNNYITAKSWGLVETRPNTGIRG